MHSQFITEPTDRKTPQVAAFISCCVDVRAKDAGTKKAKSAIDTALADKRHRQPLKRPSSSIEQLEDYLGFIPGRSRAYWLSTSTSSPAKSIGRNRPGR